MILYHFSNEKYSKLIPKLGVRKHLGQGNTTRKKVTILTTNPSMIYEDDDGDNFFKYRYTIKLDGNDPYLHVDNKFNNMLEKHIKDFDLKRDTFKWFFYEDLLDYISISEWDEKLYKFS